MRNLFYMGVIVILFLGCANSLYPKYTLTKKYPQDIPDLYLHILNDTAGVIMQKEDKSIKQNFGFVRSNKHYLIITYIDNKNSLVYLNKGDTMVSYKREIYLINEKHKLIFNMKED